MHPFINTGTTAVRKAGAFLVKAMQNLNMIAVDPKQPPTLITDIKKHAEKLIIDVLKKAYPSHGILSEMTYEPGDEYEWLIDPINGSVNFTHGVPQICTSLAIKYKNKLEHAVIYDPCHDELFTASRGSGARMNHYRIRVTSLAHLHQSLVGMSFTPHDVNTLSFYTKVLQHLYREGAAIRMIGSPALSLAYLAAGRLDAYWEKNLQPWEIAAGALLVREAGGIVMDTKGGEHYLEQGNIIATNIKFARQLLPILT